MLKIIRRDFLKATAAAAAQSAIWTVLPSWAAARSSGGTTYYPTILGTGGHNGDESYSGGKWYANVGLGRSAMESPPNPDQTTVTQPIRVPGTISNLSWGLDYNLGSSTFAALTFSLNVDSVPSSLVVSFVDGTSGWMTDSTDSVDVLPGQELSFEADTGSDGDSDFDGAFYCASVQFLSSDTGLPLVASAQMLATVGSSDIYPVVGTQKFAAFLGILGDQLDDADSIESDQQVKCLATGGRWQNMACYLQSNVFRMNTIVTNRITGSNGSMSLNISPNTSGYFEDTSDSDNVTAGDLLDYGFLPGTIISPIGSDHLTMDWIGAHFLASPADQCMIGGTPRALNLESTEIAPGSTFYSPLFGGGNASNTLPRATGMFPYGAVVSEFSNHIVGWSGGTLDAAATFNLLDETGTAVITISVTGTDTGWVTSSDSHTFAAWETCANEIFVPGTKETNQILIWGGAALLVQAS